MATRIMPRVADICFINVEWGDQKLLRGKRAQILHIQDNGRMCKFARIAWRGKEAKLLQEQFGDLFNLEELEKVS